MKTRIVRSGFGFHYVQNDWSDEDWERYQFNLELRASMGTKAILEGRRWNKDEKQFVGELEGDNQRLRCKYGVDALGLGLEQFSPL